MRKPSSVTVGICTILLLAGFGCEDAKKMVPKSVPDDILVSPDVAGRSGAPVVRFGSEVVAGLHTKIDYADGLQLEITDIKDSRCAKGAVCSDSGEVTLRASLTGGTVGQVPKEVLLSTVRARFVKTDGYFVYLSDASGSTARITVSRPPSEAK